MADDLGSLEPHPEPQATLDIDPDVAELEPPLAKAGAAAKHSPEGRLYGAAGRGSPRPPADGSHGESELEKLAPVQGSRGERDRLSGGRQGAY